MQFCSYCGRVMSTVEESARHPLECYGAKVAYDNLHQGELVKAIKALTKAVNILNSKKGQSTGGVIMNKPSVESKQKQFDEESLLEKLSELEHEQWITWASDIAKKEKLSPERLERYNKYLIPYKDLPEDVKEHDRKWARKSIQLFLKTVEEATPDFAGPDYGLWGDGRNNAIKQFKQNLKEKLG